MITNPLPGAGAPEGPDPSLQVGNDRDRSAEGRDEVAEAHDKASEARDERSEARDERAEAREEASDGADLGAASDRAGARRDRRGGASDRTQAAADRQAASADRLLSAKDRAASSIDELTGTYRRDVGTLELEREAARAARTGQPMVIAFVDLDGLKTTNDSLGHSEGDHRLKRTVDVMRTHLRSYDLIVRFGGDEFVCVLFDLDLLGAEERFEAVKAELANADEGSITFGLAELRPDESPMDLIARADADLYRKRGTQLPGSFVGGRVG